MDENKTNINENTDAVPENKKDINTSEQNAAPKSGEVKKSTPPKESNKKIIALIVVLAVVFMALAAVVVVGVIKLAANNSNVPSVTAVLGGSQVNSTTVSASSVETIGNSEVPAGGEVNPTEAKTTKKDNSKATSELTTKNYVVLANSTLPELTKTGDNLISDKPNNKYIKAVVDEYDINAELLVAIFAVPENGNNFVLQFKDERDKDGKVIRSQKNLQKVYRIDADGKITVATGKAKGNVGVSFSESVVCFAFVKTLMMPQHPDYFVINE